MCKKSHKNISQLKKIYAKYLKYLYRFEKYQYTYINTWYYNFIFTIYKLQYSKYYEDKPGIILKYVLYITDNYNTQFPLFWHLTVRIYVWILLPQNIVLIT